MLYRNHTTNASVNWQEGQIAVFKCVRCCANRDLHEQGFVGLEPIFLQDVCSLIKALAGKFCTVVFKNAN